MNLPRRQFLHLAAGAAALPAVSRIARAQAYPARPVRWVDLRNATRAVSRMYEDFLRDEGLNGTQFSLLSLIRAGKELSISTLGRAMALDRTSITRALAPLERDGLIRSRPGADKRIRIVSLTNKGRKLVEDAEPKWRQAQEALMQTIGEDRWRAMRTLLRDTTRMVRHRTITAE